MRKSIICVFSLLTVAGAMGQSRLKVTLKSGNDHWYQLQDTKITFEGSQVVFAEKGGSVAPFSFCDVAKLTIAEPPASMDKVPVLSSLSVYVSGAELRFKGVSSDDMQEITIYNLNGQRLFSAKQSLSIPISISNLSKGVYLIRTQSQTIKWLMRNSPWTPSASWLTKYHAATVHIEG